MTEQWFTFPIINEIAIEIGPIAIRWYALAYLAGIFTTMLLMNQEAKKDSSIFEPEDITRLTNFCVIGIIIGGRLGFVYDWILLCIVPSYCKKAMEFSCFTVEWTYSMDDPFF